MKPAIQTAAPELWTADQIAAYIGCSTRHVAERVTHQPGFPRPIAGLRRRRRWVADQVIAWLVQTSRAG